MIPGSAQVLAGSRRFGRVGLVATFTYWLLVLAAGILALVKRDWFLMLATIPAVDLALSIFLIGYATMFAVLALDTLRLLKLIRLPRRARIVTLVAVLAVGVLGTSTIGYAGNLAGVSSNFLGGLFSQQGFTAPENGRYNILLLGGDAARSRFGLRPDSMSVISIDAATGAALNIGIPRDLQKVPFSAGSPMLSVYPNGFSCGSTCLVNAIYKDATDNHAALYPDAAKQGSNAGVEATKDAIEGVTGLKIQSYVLVDMAGFRRLIDALGGITLDVKAPIPVGGQEDASGQPINVQSWIQPGVQHLDGYNALWYARARHGTSDYDRMQRQRAVEDAMLQQMDPATVLTHFKQIAGAGRQLLQTDIPSGMVSTYLDLAIKAKKSGISKLALVPPAVDVINPNFTAIHAMVQKAISTASASK